MNKFKKILSISGILGGLAVTAPIVLATTSCAKKEWTFNSTAEVFTYLEKHAVDVSGPHIFGNAPAYDEEQTELYKDDYKFVNENINLQFFVNAWLYNDWILNIEDEQYWQSHNGFTLKIINNDTITIKLDKQISSGDKNDSYFAEVNDTVKYKDGILNIVETFVDNEGKTITNYFVNFNFCFNPVFDSDLHHFLNVYISNEKLSYIFLFDYSQPEPEEDPPSLTISPFDWCNHSLRNTNDR